MMRLEDPWEMQAYKAYVAAAAGDEVAPRYDALLQKLDCCDGGTISNVDQRLVAKGLILILAFNRSRMIYVVELGKWTKAPDGSKALHWRDRVKHAGRTRQRGQGGAGWVLAPRSDIERDAARKVKRILPVHVVNEWKRDMAHA